MSRTYSRSGMQHYVPRTDAQRAVLEADLQRSRINADRARRQQRAAHLFDMMRDYANPQSELAI